MDQQKINFFRKHKGLVSMVLTCLMGILCIAYYYQVIEEVSELIEVPVAIHPLGSRKIILEEDIQMIRVPKCITLENVILEKDEILGKYVKPYQSVATNSLFYEELIALEEDMNDANLFSLNEGEVAMSLDVNIKTSYANSILVGHRIDLYFLGKVTINDDYNNQAIVHGEIVKNARVIAVKDENGKSIDEDSERESSVIVVALTQEDAHLVAVGKAMGTINPMISYDNINQAGTTNYFDLDKIKNIILGNSVDVTLVPYIEETSDESNIQ
ncbi:RcpC/CpaB family pilus assembly protein [Anaerorhabdus sp.]|uniref:Flp pilus assembly protein CpaB n=1 Tax=Anaerorhabdus sp. TaxID=1872524 RepID=UPI002B2078DA|nr:RcpC/CpaB family pilus assembly protein [Anaerorhabdus sp.]MEA4874335.1 RcpC/CpaB family pilus assembly protein [Anaerorhabdus sp.]